MLESNHNCTIPIVRNMTSQTLQRARDLMISARNGAMNREDRETIAGQLMQYCIELLDIANQQRESAR